MMRRAGDAAVRLARRQHPLAAQAAHLRQRRGGAGGHRAASIAKRSGTTPTPTSRSGWRRTRSPASSIRSPRMYDVPLMVARGYASLSFLHSAAEYINELGGAGLHLPPRRLRSVRRQCRREDRGDAEGVGAGRRDPSSSASPSRRSRSANGTCRPGRPRRPTRGPRTSATSRSSSTRSSRPACAASCKSAIEQHLPRRPVRGAEGGRGKRAHAAVAVGAAGGRR